MEVSLTFSPQLIILIDSYLLPSPLVRFCCFEQWRANNGSAKPYANKFSPCFRPVFKRVVVQHIAQTEHQKYLIGVIKFLVLVSLINLLDDRVTYERVYVFETKF